MSEDQEDKHVKMLCIVYNAEEEIIDINNSPLSLSLCNVLFFFFSFYSFLFLFLFGNEEKKFKKKLGVNTP